MGVEERISSSWCGGGVKQEGQGGDHHRRTVFIMKGKRRTSHRTNQQTK